MTWTLEQAIALCRLIEAIAPKYDCHVALTGGCLYKDGERKDCDLLFYRVRSEDCIDTVGLLRALRHELGFDMKAIVDGAWCVKATYQGRKVDLFFPEVGDGEYPEDDEDDDPDERRPIDPDDSEIPWDASGVACNQAEMVRADRRGRSQ